MCIQFPTAVKIPLKFLNPVEFFESQTMVEILK